MTELVSVIIPNFNYGNYLGRAIDSVLSQDYPAIEIIVVDDGSTDDSIKILESYGSRIMLIRNINYGAPTARNFGISHSKGDYIAYLDADDFWERTKVSKQMSLIKASNSLLVYCQMNIVNIEEEIIGRTNDTKSGDFKNHFLENPVSTPFIPSTLLMSRDLVSLAGYWDTTFRSPSEDFDYLRRCSKFTHFMLVDELLVSHREHSNSLTARSLIKYYLDNRLAIIKLFADEYPNLNYWRMKKCWSKLHWSFAKAFAKNKNSSMFILCVLRCLLPMLSTLKFSVS